jgi:hypothetical protein
MTTEPSIPRTDTDRPEHPCDAVLRAEYEVQIAKCWVLSEDQREFDRIWAEETAHDRG